MQKLTTKVNSFSFVIILQRVTVIVSYGDNAPCRSVKGVIKQISPFRNRLKSRPCALRLLFVHAIQKIHL
jgi:hypothetical protein